MNSPVFSCIVSFISSYIGKKWIFLSRSFRCCRLLIKQPLHSLSPILSFIPVCLSRTIIHALFLVEGVLADVVWVCLFWPSQKYAPNRLTCCCTEPAQKWYVCEKSNATDKISLIGADAMILLPDKQENIISFHKEKCIDNKWMAFSKFCWQI